MCDDQRLRGERQAPMSRAAAQVSDEDMGLINVYALRALSPEDVIVREALVCNDQPDSYDTQFTRAALDQVARMLPGSPVLRNHSTFGADDLPVGIWFSARTEERDGVYWVIARFYMIREPLTESIAARMDGGVVREVSVSWWMDRSALSCSICGNFPFADACTHTPGDTYGGRKCVTVMNAVESVEEASLVWKGGQYGTAILAGEQEQRVSLMARLARKRGSSGAPAVAQVDAMTAWWNDPLYRMRPWFKSRATDKETT